jgi:hypothetical protein
VIEGCNGGCGWGFTMWLARLIYSEVERDYWFGLALCRTWILVRRSYLA